MNKKKILSVLAATAVVATNIAPAHAAVVDYIRENDGVYYSYDVKELRKQMAAADLGLKAPMFDRFMKDEDTKYLNDDKAGYVSADKVRKAMAEADLKDEEFILDDYTESVKGEEVKEDIKVVDEEGNVEDDSTELEVKSVSAITKTVDSETPGSLEFAINGKEEAANLEEVEEAGYTVEFKSNKAVFGENSGTTSLDGKLESLTDIEEFIYEVVVTETETGKEIKSDRVTVQVEEYASTVVSIDRLELHQNVNKLDVNTISAKDKDVKVVAYGKTKADAEDTEAGALIATNLKFKSSNDAIAEVDEDGKLTLHGLVGDVTITVTAGDIEKTIDIKVVNEERELSVENSKISVTEIKDAVDAPFEFEVELKDNFNEPMTGKEITFAKDGVIATDTETATATEKEDAEGVYVVKGKLAEKATEKPVKVEVKVGEKVLGEISVTIVEKGKEVAATEIKADKTKLDVVKSETETATITVIEKDEKGYTLEEVKADGSSKGTDGKTVYKLKVPANSKIVAEEESSKGTLKALAAGKETVEVIKVDGGLEDSIGTVEIEVIDSTPELKSVEFAKVDKITEVSEEGISLESLIKSFDLDGSGDYENIEKLTITDGVIKASSYEKELGKFIVTPSSLAKMENGVIKVIDNKEGETKGTITVVIADEKGKEIASTTIEVEIPATETDAE